MPKVRKFCDTYFKGQSPIWNEFKIKIDIKEMNLLLDNLDAQVELFKPSQKVS